jgi:hypothetical protein
MQSLGQAVYRFICKHSPRGVEKRTIIAEMDSRGYLPPLKERVEGALQEYLVANSPHSIILRRGRYLKRTRADYYRDFLQTEV